MKCGKDFTMEIYDYMKNYKDYRKEFAVYKQAGVDCCENERKLDFLDYCMGLLEEYERKLISAVCFEGLPVRRYSRISGFSRYYICKERDRIIELFNKYFKVKFDSSATLT